MPCTCAHVHTLARANSSRAFSVLLLFFDLNQISLDYSSFFFLQAQLVVLASQIAWSESCENALQSISSSSNPNDLEPMLKVLRVVEATLNILADSVLQEQPPVRRRKLEHLVSFSLLFCLVVWMF